MIEMADRGSLSTFRVFCRAICNIHLNFGLYPIDALRDKRKYNRK
jgi:hypothetical protein